MTDHRSRMKLWLLILAGLLLAPALPVRANESASDTVTLSASVVTVFTTIVPEHPGDCRMVYASGTGPNGSAYCVYQTPLTISVASSFGWSSTIVTIDDAGNAPGMSVQSQAVRYTTTAPAASFSEAASSPHLSTSEATWLPNQAPGVTERDYFLALRVTGQENPTGFEAIMTIQIASSDSGPSLTLTIPIAFNPS